MPQRLELMKWSPVDTQAHREARLPHPGLCYRRGKSITLKDVASRQ